MATNLTHGLKNIAYQSVLTVYKACHVITSCLLQTAKIKPRSHSTMQQSEISHSSKYF